MKYAIGVDLHKETAVIAVLDGEGKIVEQKIFSTKCKQMIRDYFSSYGLQCEVAFESVGFYQWFWELVKPVVGKLHLGDPVGIRARAGRKAKTDKNDALIIAEMLLEGKIPEAYVPEEPYASLRKLVRFRCSIARNLAHARKALRWICLKTNLPGPSILTSDRAQKWLLSQDQKFSDTDRKSGRLHIDIIKNTEYALADIEREIEDYIKKVPELHARWLLLRSIPGIGPIAAAVIISETADILRFSNAGQICCYAGLAPRVSQSGETIRHGHISKQGPPILRWVLQQAAWVAIRCSIEAKKIFNRISRKAGRKKAVTAMARKLLVYAWSVCKRNQPFKWEIKGDTQNIIRKNIIGEWCYQI